MAFCGSTAPGRRGEIDWNIHFVDATIVRAHQHAAGARRDGGTSEEAQAREALGRSQGGFTTKGHLRAEGNGRPITAVLTGGGGAEENCPGGGGPSLAPPAGWG